MADYQDFELPSNWGPAEAYRRITHLLHIAYSVEVLSSETGVKLRIWFDEHCDPETHNKLS